ncbi:MAG: NUDIX domain-containing protein, partial [Microscillaceae bacterium]|nr:NUDIX domain-containing protein [Microscillaceae bacterium]
MNHLPTNIDYAQQFLTSGDKYLPHLSLDCVIFGFHHQQLKVLLLKFKKMDYWALPGGHILKEEDIEMAASRVLAQRTGLTNIFLEQFRVFGKPNRVDEELMQKILTINDLSVPADCWLFQRYVSVGYYALVDFSQVNPQPDVFSEVCEWVNLNQLPHLVFDHQEIIESALATLRASLDSKLVGSNLLPETFTMNELQSLYETILG